MAGMFWFRQGPSRNAANVAPPGSATYIYVRSVLMETDNLQPGRELDAKPAEEPVKPAQPEPKVANLFRRVKLV